MRAAVGLSSLQRIDRFDAVGALIFRRVHLPADAVEFELAVEVLRQKDLRFDRRTLPGSSQASNAVWSRITGHPAEDS
jgi:hypothetical protein